VHIDEPTIAMAFTINTSPFAGREGQWVTSRNLRDRLMREHCWPRPGNLPADRAGGQ